MAENKQSLNEKLILGEQQKPYEKPPRKLTSISNQSPAVYVYHSSGEQGMQLKRPITIPTITLTGLSLALMCPILFCVHLYVAHIAQIPTIQYIFMTLFVAFVVNYIFLIRKYEISPFLVQEKYDNQLKVACLLGFIGVLSSLIWGWNGSGGLLFAMIWENFRGNKMGSFKYLYAVIIIGSLLMEDHFTLMKLVEFIPGVLFGISNSIIFQLKQSSTYTLTHQFIFLTSICLPIFFPSTHIIVPNLLQWGVMIVTGFSMYFTVLCTVKLMQTERVSIVMAVYSGIIMVGTSTYFGAIDFIGAALISLGVIFIVKKEFLDLEF